MLSARLLPNKCLTHLTVLRHQPGHRHLSSRHLAVRNISETTLAREPLTLSPASTGARTTPTRPPVVISIDPDSSGALAVVQVQRAPQEDVWEIDDTLVTLYDNPCEVLLTKTGGKRRQADSRAVAKIVRDLAAAGHSSAGARVVLEKPRFNPTNGMFSAYSTGYSYGVWHGALAAHGFVPETVSCTQWKRDLQLNGKGKDGSRQLALRLFPSAADLLKRKKDHGRAEAMLIAAWALGVRAMPDAEEALAPGAASSADAAALAPDLCLDDEDVILSVEEDEQLLSGEL